jgi:hypothetical protein
MASYLHHVNPFLRLYDDIQLHYVKMFVRTGLCNHVRTHGCDEGVNGTDGSPLDSAIGSNKVRAVGATLHGPARACGTDVGFLVQTYAPVCPRTVP